jgi:hypothetical protein
MLAKGIDFLGDPGRPVKHPDQVFQYNYILTLLTPGRLYADFVTTDFWAKLAPLVKRLNEEKYKKDGMPPGAVMPSEFKLLELHEHFEKLQTELEEKWVCGEGAMPFNMLDYDKLNNLHDENALWNSELGKKQREDESPHVVGAFVASLGQSLFSKFATDMRTYLKGFNPKVSAKGNVLRIA